MSNNRQEFEIFLRACYYVVVFFFSECPPRFQCLGPFLERKCLQTQEMASGQGGS